MRARQHRYQPRCPHHWRHLLLLAAASLSLTACQGMFDNRPHTRPDVTAEDNQSRLLRALQMQPKQRERLDPLDQSLTTQPAVNPETTS